MRWMWKKGETQCPVIVLFRCAFETDGKDEVRFEYSADESCQLFLDGRYVAPGPETGAPGRWYFARYAARLTPGRHTLVARVWAMGKDFGQALAYQTSVRPGFYCTLPGEWSCRKMTGITFEKPWPDWGNFPRFHTTEELQDSWLAGRGEEWETPEYFDDDRTLFPPELPPGRSERCRSFRQEKGMIVFDEYVCVRTEFHFSGRGSVRMRWSETPYLTSSYNRHNLKGEKGRRDGRFFVGDFDTVAVNGKTRWLDFVWRAGRYLEIRTTGSARLEKAVFHRTGYRYPDVIFPRGKWKKTLEMAKRTLECCSHTTFMDCPFYERMQYIGDTRCEALALYALGGDPALVRKALRLTVLPQTPDGAIPCRYPCKISSDIPSFIPAWIIMFYDYWKWTQDAELVRELLPAARKIAELFRASRREDGLIYLAGWGFIDWQWPLRGVPYGSDSGTNSIVNELVVLAWQKLAELERHCGCPEEAERCTQDAADLWGRVKAVFFDPASSRMADDPQKMFFSEHAQILALLAENNPALLEVLRKGVFHTKCGIYFASYYMEACEAYGEKELLRKRLEEYLELPELGLSTLPEDFTAARSDCHAWGAHILLHYKLLSGKEYRVRKNAKGER